MNVKLVITLFFIFGLIVGFIAGFYSGINLVVDRIVKLLPVFTNISVDYQAINDALFKYNNQINTCIS